MNGTTIGSRLRTRGRELRSALTDSPRVKRIGCCAAAFFGALLLAAVPLGSRPLPLAAGLTLAVSFLPYSPLTALGAIAGYVLCWPWALGLEGVAVTVLCFAGAGLFHDAGLRENDWFAPLLCAALCGTVGFVFLLDGGLSPGGLSLYTAKLAFAGLSPTLCRRALSGQDRAGRSAFALLLFVGLTCLFPPVSAYAAAAIACAAAVCFDAGPLLPTLLAALGLDLTRTLPVSMCVPLIGAALLRRMLPGRSALLRGLLFPAVLLAWELCAAQVSLPLTLAAAVGSGAGLLLPQPRHHARPAAALPPADPALPLRRVARVFGMLHRELSGPDAAQPRTEIAAVYDAAAETVCRMCVRSSVCWEQEAERTYGDLCAAAGPILQRCSAVREDFPPSFSDGCRHMEGFLTAVNQALEAGRSRRQARNRLHEGRRVLASQYLFLSRFLGKLADETPQPEPRAVYAPEFGVSSACRPGNAVSGDRGASFRDRRNHFFVLLCDGMGSGPDAARESGRAVSALTGLLEAGVEPDAALEILNGFYVLRQSSAFSTVDLLRVDLATGTGVLYKWGAAPSYLKTGEEIRQLGVPTPPPGLSADAPRGAWQERLSLRNGETLIMVSDGAFCEAAARRAAKFGGGTARELASWVVNGLRESSEDDLTAAVVRLTPAAEHKGKDGP